MPVVDVKRRTTGVYRQESERWREVEEALKFDEGYFVGIYLHREEKRNNYDSSTAMR